MVRQILKELIQICPRLCQEIIETRCILSVNKSGAKHKSINRRYCHCHSQVLSSVAANLGIVFLSLPRFTITSGRPDVVAAFIYKHTVSHYGIVHQVCFCLQGGALPVSLETASRLMSLIRCGHGSRVCLVAFSSVYGLSE